MQKKFTSILKWFTELGNIVKTLVTIISLGGLIFGGVRTYNHSVIRKHDNAILSQRKQVNDSTLFQNMKIAIVKLDSLTDKVDKLSADQKSESQTVGIIKTQLGNHIINTATKQDILNWVNAFEKKNNETSTLVTPLSQNNYINPLILTSK